MVSWTLLIAMCLTPVLAFFVGAGVTLAMKHRLNY